MMGKGGWGSFSSGSLTDARGRAKSVPDCDSYYILISFTTESLILAQDER